jgi:2',3'-cyclic-nucleotide 2'-phosphodiesterase (5'-nucleotidase family)
LNPVNTGRRVVEDLQGEADVIILLAAMPWTELMALLPQVPGITIAVAGHHPNGIRSPMQAGQTIAISCPGYGRYIGMLKLTLKAVEAPFVDEARITALERELAALEKRIKEGTAGSFSEAKERMEAELHELKRGNIYRSELIMLSSEVREDRAVQKLIEDFKDQHQRLEQGCQ